MFLNSDEPKILTESEIMELKKKHGIVLFYMDGCGHCETMKPAWNKLINELKERNADIPVRFFDSSCNSIHGMTFQPVVLRIAQI